MIRFIYQDLVIEFETSEDLFNDPLFLLQKQKLESEDVIQKLKSDKNLFDLKENHRISRIENHIGFSLNDDESEFKLNQLSEIIKIQDILYQHPT